MKKQYLVEKSTGIDARPQDIFKVLLDVGRWKEWTPSIISMSLPDNRRPETGARIKVLQPKLAPAEWTITEVDPPGALTWEKKSFGLSMRSEHLVESLNNETRVTIRMTYKGPLAGLVYMLTHSLVDRYMTMEIDGLKRKMEGAFSRHPL